MNYEKGKIYETDQYDMFRYLEGNRPVKYSYQLEKAALETGLLYQIIVNEKMEIIDGQNRLEVCKRLGIPVRYEVKNGAGNKEVISLNTTSKKWTLTDYIEHFHLMGNVEYTLLKTAMNERTARSSIIATALGRANESGGINQIVKEGKFEFLNYEKYCEFLTYVDKFSEITKIDVGHILLPTLYAIYTIENFDGDRFINKLFETKNEERISHMKDRNKMLEIFITEVNNHKLGTTSKNYIEYTYSSGPKKEIIIVSKKYEWSKTKEAVK